MAIDVDTVPLPIYEPVPLRDGAIVEPGGSIRLVAFDRTSEELERSIAARMDPTIQTQFTPGLVRTEDEIRQTVTETFASDRVALFAIMDENGDILGEIDLSAIDRTEKTAYLTRLIYAPENRGKGVGTKATRMLLSYAKQIGFTSIFAEVDGDNKAARKILEKLPVTVRVEEDVENEFEFEIHLDQWEPPISVEWVPR